MTLGIKTLFHYAECRCAESRILFIVMLNVIMLSVAMLSAVMLNVIMMSFVMLNVIMLSVVMLNLIMLSVVAPLCWVSLRLSIDPMTKILMCWQVSYIK